MSFCPFAHDALFNFQPKENRMTMLLIAVVILVLLEITLKALERFRRSTGLDWLPPTVNTDQVIDALPGVSERISTAPVWTAYGLLGKSVSDRTPLPKMI